MAPTESSLSTSKKALTKCSKYKTMTMVQKATIFQQVESGWSQAEVAREFSISKQALLDYIKNKGIIQTVASKPTGSQKKYLSNDSHQSCVAACHNCQKGSGVWWHFEAKGRERALRFKWRSTILSSVMVGSGTFKKGMSSQLRKCAAKVVPLTERMSRITVPKSYSHC